MPGEKSMYKTGTISVTNGSQTVTGSGTSWLANVAAGDWLFVGGDGTSYEVGSVGSDTGITLTANYAGTTASGKSYGIGNVATSPDNILLMSTGDIETPAIFSRAMQAIQSTLTGVRNLQVGFDNAIINGGFDRWDYATSQTSSGYGSANRWRAEHFGSTKTASQQAFTVGQTDVPGEPQYYARQVVSSVAGAGNYAIWRYRVEDVRTFAGQTVTLSFYAKADAEKNMATEFRQFFGSGGSAVVNQQGVTTHSLTTSWQRFTVTVTLPSISGKTIGTGSALEVLFWFDAGSTFNPATNSLGNQSGTFDIANVKLELGSNATTYQKRPPGVELALCRRYARVASIWVGTSTAKTMIPIDMRATPSISGGGTGFNSTGTTADSLICFQTTAAAQTLTLDSEL